jgi:hypothetical protein
MKSRHDHWPRARDCLILAEETSDENDRQVLLEMASAWIERGLEEGLGDGRNSPSTDRSLERRGPSTGSIAAGIPIAIISAVKRLRTKINGTFSSISTQLK